MRLSATMAVESLREQVSSVRELEEALARERNSRDELIRDARACALPYDMLMRLTGLSRQRLHRIIVSGVLE